MGASINMTRTKFRPKKFPFYIAPKLKHKLDILIKQLKKEDAWILIDGAEGSGKTNTAAYLLYYFHCKTGRPFSVESFYFDAEELFNFAKKYNEQLLNWDEAALGGLSSEWWNKSQINLIKLSLTGRIKHHVFILCIPRFNKLKEDLRLDRPKVMIHTTKGKRNNKYGSCMYLTRRGIRALNRLWSKKKIRAYAKCMRSYGGFGFWIPYVQDKIMNIQEYERKKLEAIEQIGKKNISRAKKDLKKYRYRTSLAYYDLDEKNKKILVNRLKITPATIKKWKYRYEPEKKGKDDKD